MPVEELDVAVQVFVEIAARDKRPALGLDHPHSQRAREQDDGPERAPSQTLQGREQAGQAPSHAPEASGGRGEALPRRMSRYPGQP